MQTFLQNLNSFEYFLFWVVFNLVVSGVPSLFGFKFWAKKWIENKFAEKLARTKSDFDKELEEIKHKFAQEIEKQKLQIDDLLSRANKLHEKEFEILPTVWAYLHEAYNAIEGAMIRLNPPCDLDDMSPTQLKKFISKSELKFNFSEKQAMMSSRDRLPIYDKILHKHKFADATKFLSRFIRYVDQNSIFMEPDLQNEFQDIEKHLKTMLMAVDPLRTQSSGTNLEQYLKSRGEFKLKLEKIETILKSRIYPHIQENREKIDPKK